MSEDRSWSRTVIATAIALPVAVNLFTNLFRGSVAIVVMLAALFVAVALMQTSNRRRQESPTARRTPHWKSAFRRTGAMVLIGALIGGICVLPVFPARSIVIPVLNEIAHSISHDLSGSIAANGYELLATAVISAVAVVTVLRTRSVLTALQFTLAACAGAVAVFAAVRGQVDFFEPILTYLGVVAGAAVIVGVVALAPAVVETLRHMWKRQSPDVNTHVEGSESVESKVADTAPLTRRALRRRSSE